MTYHRFLTYNRSRLSTVNALQNFIPKNWNSGRQIVSPGRVYLYLWNDNNSGIKCIYADIPFRGRFTPECFHDSSYFPPEDNPRLLLILRRKASTHLLFYFT